MKKEKGTKKKKKYVKPQIFTEKIFDKTALACGKCISGNPVFTSTCLYLPRLS